MWFAVAVQCLGFGDVERWIDNSVWTRKGYLHEVWMSAPCLFDSPALHPSIPFVLIIDSDNVLVVLVSILNRPS